jgi:hypothetical protein
LCCRRGPQKLVDLVDQHLGVEGLGQVAVGQRGGGLGRVERLEGSSQQEHRDLPELGVGFEGVRQLIAVAARHRDVGQHDGRMQLPGAGVSVLPIVHRHHREVLGGECDGDDLLNRDAVVREEQRAGH